MCAFPTREKVAEIAHFLSNMKAKNVIYENEQILFADMKNSKERRIDDQSSVKMCDESVGIIRKTNAFKSYKRPKRDCDGKENRKMWNRCDWFANNCDRETAERLLASAKCGTFLIRKSSLFHIKGYYALSIVCNDRVYHCLINDYNNGIGFTESPTFATLEQLVEYYRSQKSLIIHNHLLNTNLLYAAFARCQ